VVIEPICISASARRLMDGKLLNAMLSLLFPAYLVVTLNSLDGRLLAPEVEAPAAVVKPHPRLRLGVAYRKRRKDAKGG
jgi:hydroxymethylpyrimidine/phosphomethylpyrimidine kinase